MSEPLRTSTDRVPATGPQRDALIEALLVAGLDHYFEGQYEQAVNVWTRVAFLERGHRRARAYIDRARAALAEQQRQAEELLHRGIAAYEAGDLQTARDLLSRAVADGSANETALVFLQRLGRVEALDVPAAPGREPQSGSDARLSDRPRRSRPRAASEAAPPRPSWIATAAVSIVVTAAILLAAQPIASWLGERPIAAPPVSSRPADTLPIVRASDIQMARARALFARGRHRDALLALDGIGVADPLRPDSDRLKAEIQRALLGAAASAPGAETRP
jgi:hypothetical protein